MTRPIRVLVADDHPPTRAGVRMALEAGGFEVCAQVGAHTAYVERTNLTSRQMNGRLVRKTLSYSKQLDMLEAACAWEDWVYPLTPCALSLTILFYRVHEPLRNVRRIKHHAPDIFHHLIDFHQ